MDITQAVNYLAMAEGADAITSHSIHIALFEILDDESLGVQAYAFRTALLAFDRAMLKDGDDIEELRMDALQKLILLRKAMTAKLH